MVAYLVKTIALEGDRSDYEDLPLEVREEILKMLKWYQEAGGWFVVSSTKMENYDEYAEKFIRKVGLID